MSPYALIFLSGLLVGALFGVAFMAFMQGAARLGEDDPEEPIGYVDQDGERTPARHQWGNVGAKAHYSEPQ